MRAITGGVAARSRSSSASGDTPGTDSSTRTVGSLAPGNEPPPTSEKPSTSGPLCNASARRLISAMFSVSMRSTGISARAMAGSRYSPSVASNAASVSLSARTARATGSLWHASMAARRLVAREHHQVESRGDRLRHGGLAAETPRREIEQQSRAEIERTRQALRAGERGDIGRLELRGKARHLEIRAVHLEQQPRAAGDRLFVVLLVGAVGGADFHQAGAGARHD